MVSGAASGPCVTREGTGTHGRPVCRATKSWMLKMWWLDKSPHFIPPNRDKATAPGMRPSYPRYFPFHIFTCTTEIWMLSSSLKNCKRKFEWIRAWQQGTGKDWDNSELWFFLLLQVQSSHSTSVLSVYVSWGTPAALHLPVQVLSFQHSNPVFITCILTKQPNQDWRRETVKGCSWRLNPSKNQN